MYFPGSEVTFRLYGVLCIIVLAAYAGVNFYLERTGRFSHQTKMPAVIDDSAHLAPHGVSSGIGRDMSSSKLQSAFEQDGYNNQQRGELNSIYFLSLSLCSTGYAD